MTAPDVPDAELLEEEDPVELEEGDDWPEPPPEWGSAAHAEEHADDPDVAVTEDEVT